MSEHNIVHQSRMSHSNSPESLVSREAIAGESSIQRHSKIRRFLGKVQNGVTKQISRSKDSCSPDANRAGARTIEVQGTPHGVEQGAGPQLPVLGAHETPECTNAPSRPPVAAAPAPRVQPDLGTTEAIKSFDSVMRGLADVHPYAKVALSTFLSASKVILAQTNRDEAVASLLYKLEQVYNFITQDDMLRQLSSMDDIIGQIAQQTLECANFIAHYSETKSFWTRIGKNVISETDDTIKGYNDVLNALMQKFRDRVARDTAVHVHRTGEILDLSGMAYAAGAGQDSRKQCLPGTRTEILSRIMGWINNTADDIPRVLWLSGPAGTAGRLGSCFCFDRYSEADHRHEKIFSTIARDMADRDQEFRRALSDAKLLMEPLGKLSESSVGPIVIVIDALNESGGVETRRDLLRILAGKLRNSDIPPITELPNNVRFIVTSAPLRDIDAEFDGASHILRISMGDIRPEVTRRDIHAYVSVELEGLSDFGDREFGVLAGLADGLFEWARLACASIRATPFGLSPRDAFNAAVSRDPAKQAYLLSNMYHSVLADIMRTDTYTHAEFQQMQLARFRSVMGQILGAAEPLPINSMNAMRRHFPDEVDHYDVDVVVGRMGSLLGGTTNSYTPVRPFHASFREFLTNQKISGRPLNSYHHNGRFFPRYQAGKAELTTLSSPLDWPPHHNL
ncbi:hypothetical protein BDR07DRAFT_1615578 [Suillus spraguei]|nr:hypothetical protein BDR07DRAFT_1615578 [Suillus spraguei]